MTWTGFSPGFRPSRGFLLGRISAGRFTRYFEAFSRALIRPSGLDAPSLGAQFAIACKEILPLIFRQGAGWV